MPVVRWAPGINADGLFGSSCLGPLCAPCCGRNEVEFSEDGELQSMSKLEALKGAALVDAVAVIVVNTVVDGPVDAVKQRWNLQRWRPAKIAASRSGANFLAASFSPSPAICQPSDNFVPDLSW